MSNPIINPTDPALSSRFLQAYEATAADRRALKPEDLTRITVDVSKSVTTVLGAWPEIVALRPAIMESLPRFDIRRFDKVEQYALAAGYAHALYLPSAQPKGPIEDLVALATSDRDLLASDVDALAHRKLLDASGVPALRGDGSYRAIGFHVLGLVGLLRKAWPSIAGKTACQLADLDRAAKVADELVVAVGQREQAPVGTEEIAAERQRAFTLMAAAYDQVRRAIAHLRWDEGDAETIAPSLYAGRTSDRRGKTDTTPAPAGGVATAPPAAPLPAAAPGLPNSPSFTVG